MASIIWKFGNIVRPNNWNSIAVIITFMMALLTESLSVHQSHMPLSI